MIYLTTRPALASVLKEMGYKGRTAKHPYDELLKSWVFDLDEPGVEFIAAWLDERGRKLVFPSQEELDASGYLLADRANKIPAQTIAKRFIPDQIQGERCRCLRCGWERGIIFTDNGKFFCRNCGAGGTGIGFVMLMGVTSEAAAKMICDEFGV